MSKDLTYIAKTNFRDKEQIFGIKRPDRRQHMYVIGKTGAGKTAFLKNMALQDIENGQGLAIIDPHGEFVEEVLDNIPAHRMNDVVYFNPADMEHPISFNIMDVQDPKYKHLIASGLIGIFTKIWANVWSARMEYILANCILALLDTPGTTLLGIPRMLVDRDYRQKIINNLKDPVVKSFWVNEYEEWEPRYRNEAIAPVQNKVGQFLNVSFVRNIVGQARSTINVEDIMNNQKILLVNVSKGRIGEDNSSILGAMLITKIQLSAMERVRIPEDERKDFYLYVDEFQNFATDSFVNILSEARKYRLDLTIAHQYIGQLTTDTSTAVRDAVFGNVGTMISFRVGAADAEFLEQEFTPEFLQNDLIRLPNYNIYLKLMIDGIASRPFSAKTIAPPPLAKDDKKREEIIKISRSKYAHTVKEVEEEINRWAGSIDVPVNNNGSSDISNPQRSQDFPKRQNQSNAPRSPDQPKLYDVKCSSCGKDTKVIFPPEPGRAVYCKNCLKKLKEQQGQSQQAGSSQSKSNSPARESVKTPQANSSRKSSSNSVLAGMGIEFAPSPDVAPSRQVSRPSSMTGRASPHSEKKSAPGQSLDNIIKTAERVSFSSNRNKENKKPRKEVDLGDLKKALEESLSKTDYKPKDSQDELKQRLEEEKFEDKVSEEK
ncbi:MAG: type IV secretion system DNA-binding domain-containing protein [Candidatus Staskawiczbacteria bacterium]|jgi:CxxC-x17-CxxC domain-containing protein